MASPASAHQTRAAPCTADALAPLTQLGAITSEAQAVQFGLAPPSGGLMGSWQIIRLSNYASYSGRQSAVAALDAQGERAVANWAFAPQLAQAAGDAAKLHTTDPVLTANGLQWSDLPDLSTPLLGKSAISQVNELVAGIAAARVLNEFVSQSEDAGVPAATDWVISLPMRRYSAAYDHATKAMVYAPGHEHWRLSSTVGRRQLGHQALGNFICVRTNIDPNWRDREGEWRGELSAFPGTTAGLCGNVFIVTIDGQIDAPSAVLQARLTTFDRRTNPVTPATAGWLNFDIRWPGPWSNLSPSGVIGYAATSLRNKDQNGNYGSVVPHVRLRD